MSITNGKYVSTDDEIARKRWNRIRTDADFADFADFYEWISQYPFRGRAMKKLDESKPWSRENAYMVGLQDGRKKQEAETIAGNPCLRCKLSECTTNGRGCAEWQRWYTDNWNTNIHQDVPEWLLSESENREAWCYPHPHEVGK